MNKSIKGLTVATPKIARKCNACKKETFHSLVKDNYSPDNGIICESCGYFEKLNI